MTILLKRGDSSEAIEKWQAFLKGRYPSSNINVDGIFGEETEKATITFQKENSLSSDGIVGNDTLNRAKIYGFSLSYIPQLTVLEPLNSQQRELIFGKFPYKAKPLPGNPENIEINRSWISDNKIGRAHV